MLVLDIELALVLALALALDISKKFCKRWKYGWTCKMWSSFCTFCPK